MNCVVVVDAGAGASADRKKLGVGITHSKVD